MTAAADTAAAGPAAGRRTLDQLLADRALATPDGVGHQLLDAGRQWQPRRWRELHAAAQAAAGRLAELGLQPGERVAFIATSGSDWDVMQWAVLAARGVVVGVDAHAGAAQIDAALALAHPAALVVDDAARLPAGAGWRFAIALRGSAPAFAAAGQPVLPWSELQRAPAAVPPPAAALPDDEAWIVFTSGTTGQPKGVVYRHHQVRLAVDAILDAFADIAPQARLASWLPLSNPFQRIVNLCAMTRGAVTYYVEDPRQVMVHLPAIRPQVFIGVPRFFEKFHAGAVAAVGAAGGLQAAVGGWALRVADALGAVRAQGGPAGLRLRTAGWLAERLVFRRIRSAFGGELRYLVSGSAPMPRWLLDRLAGIGLPVLEAYGLSECIVPVASNRIDACRAGSVGRPMHGVQVRLTPDGELLVRSAGVFDGYLGLPDEVGQRDAEGWLATGDLAEIDADGYIRLVGRRSEVFKTSTGRRVAPQAIEAVLRSLPGVEHAAVFGAGRATLLGLVALAPDAPPAAEALADAVRHAAAALPEYLRPAGLVVTRRPLDIASGELTSNLKLRRQVIGERYAAALAALAAAVDAPAGERVRSVAPGDVELVLL